MTGGSASGKKPTATDAALIGALQDALDNDDVSSPELRDAVFHYVNNLRSQAEAPQDVIIALKSHVQRVSLQDTEVEENDLVDRVIKWGIDAYYR